MKIKIIRIVPIALIFFALYGCDRKGNDDNTNVAGDGDNNGIGSKPPTPEPYPPEPGPPEPGPPEPDPPGKNIPPKSDAGPDQPVFEETVVTLDGSKSTDPDGNISHFEWKQITSFELKLENPTEAITTFRAPKVSKDEELIFELKVTDDKGSESTDTVVIKVSVNAPDKNQPPESSAGPDQPEPDKSTGLINPIYAETFITLDGSNSTDPEGNISRFEWKEITSFNVKLNNPTEAITTFRGPKVSKDEELTFELKVTDDKGIVSTDTVVVKVSVNPPDPNKFLALLGSAEKEGEKSAKAYYEAIDPGGHRKTLDEWKKATNFDKAADAEEAHAIYVNALDLGFGRNMYFRRNAVGTSASYVENYATLEDAINKKRLIATVAMEHSPKIKDGKKLITKFFAFNEKGERIIKLDLDGRGNKYVPGVCNVCHGGGPKPFVEGSPYPDHGDTGAHFIPWDLDNLEYGVSGGTYSREEQEDSFRLLNQLAYRTYPDPDLDPNSDSKWTGKAARDLIDGWYGGSVLAATGLFNKDFVPEGWSGHEVLYKKVVAPSCQACHIMRVTGANDDSKFDIDFSSFDKFKEYDLLIKLRVCGTGQMPLARLTYVKFWRDELAVQELRKFLDSPECKAKD